ncbi:MAG: chromophore lyase CpcT/CpeT [Flavobacteriales bacterium]|nr:chromophore lyase CpcT/CpeT [Flavobacteriales bacterium]
MLKQLLATITVIILPLVSLAQNSSSLEALASIMEGSYSSSAQALLDTNYFNIELEMVRIWPERIDGAWLYVEQATAANKEKPYRQRVYHVQQVNEDTFTSDILSINSGEKYYGAYKDPLFLSQISPDSVAMLSGCTITLTQKGDNYVGSTNERDCSNAWGKASYATSEVSISPGLMVSWDRGYNDAGEQVWGAENGGYHFVKKP